MVSGRCEEIGCHAERSEASAFISLKTNKCRFLASLGMTRTGDFSQLTDTFFWKEAWERFRASILAHTGNPQSVRGLPLYRDYAVPARLLAEQNRDGALPVVGHDDVIFAIANEAG